MKITHTESLIAAPQDGKPGPPGPPGGDAVSVIVSTDNIVFKKNNSQQTVFVDVKVMDGDFPVPYGSGGDDGYNCSTLNVPEGMGWSFVSNSEHTFAYVIRLKADCIVNTEIPFRVTYRNEKYAQSLFISTVENGNDGMPGEKGSAPRGPQDWDEIPYGYHFMSGAKGERFYDVVLYKGIFWECKVTHEKSSVNFPGNPNANYKNFWQRDTFFSIVCTKLLLANYALIRNLGAEALEMTDAEGNIVFQAKDGNVECNTGKFKNVIIDGTIHGRDGYFSGLLKRKMTEINESNIASYSEVLGNRLFAINFELIGTFVKVTQAPELSSCMPWKWLFSGYQAAKRSNTEKNRFSYEKALEYVGCSIIMYIYGQPCVPSIGGNIRYTGSTRYYNELGDLKTRNYNYADIDDVTANDPGAWAMLWEGFVYEFTCEFDKQSQHHSDVIWHCRQLGRKM